MVAEDMEAEAQGHGASGFVFPPGGAVLVVPAVGSSYHQVRFERIAGAFHATCTDCQSAYGAEPSEDTYLAARSHFQHLSCIP